MNAGVSSVTDGSEVAAYIVQDYIVGKYMKDAQEDPVNLYNNAARCHSAKFVIQRTKD